MKKLIALLLALVMTFALCGCGKSEAANAVEEAIKNIGEISLSSGSLIESANKAYSNLTDKEKSSIENYSTLVNAKKEYSELCESILEKARQKISDFDMENAYNMLLELPDDYRDEANDLIEKINNLCYDDTFFVRAENVFSVAPSTTEITPQGTFLIYAYNFNSASSVETAMSEYYKYLSQHYSTNDNANTSYSSVNAQSYEFYTKTGHVIKLTSISFVIYAVNITIELDTNYRETN